MNDALLAKQLVFLLHGSVDCRYNSTSNFDITLYELYEQEWQVKLNTDFDARDPEIEGHKLRDSRKYKQLHATKLYNNIITKHMY